MVRMLAASALDCGSTTQSDRVNTMTMSYTNYFNARYTKLRNKSTDWLVVSLENMSEWSDMSTSFQQNLTCSCHDEAVFLYIYIYIYMFIWSLLIHLHLHYFFSSKDMRVIVLIQWRLSASNAVYYNKCNAHWQEYLTNKKLPSHSNFYVNYAKF